MIYKVVSAISLSLIISKGVLAQGLPDQTWPAGTFLSELDRGGRLSTYHRGYVYLAGLPNTTVWDISNPTSPSKIDELPSGGNGHIWNKIGDLFFRHYDSYEVPGPVKFMDFSDMHTRAPWSTPMPFPLDTWMHGSLPTYPYHFAGEGAYDMRDGELKNDIYIQSLVGVTAHNSWRLGNILFITPSDTQSGFAMIDISDIENPVVVGVLAENVQQYTDTWHVWRNYLVLMQGDDTNGSNGDTNAVFIDFSDPSNLHVAFEYKQDVMPGRYVHFQDEFAFSGHGGKGHKVNLETGEVVAKFNPPSGGWFGDFQWIPYGHILMSSTSETEDPGQSRTYFFSHQDNLDTKAPTVGYHLPVDGATNQSLSTVIGLVINETLDDTTLNDQTIQIKPVGGNPISGTVVSSSYNVINYQPKQPLSPNTTYEVTMVANGIHDVAGNGMEEYKFLFSTGNTITGITNVAPSIQSVSFSPSSPVTVNTSVDFTAAANDADGDALEYRWTFGDGTPQTNWSGSANISHTYNAPGNFKIVAQVRDSAGNSTSKTADVAIEEPIATVFPQQSSQMILDEEARRIWTVNPDNNTVSVVDADTFNKVQEIPVDKYPSSLARDSRGNIWVSNRDSDSLSIISTSSLSVIDEISLPYGAEPLRIVFSPDGRTAFVAESAGKRILKISATTRNIVDTLSLDFQPKSLAVSADAQTLYIGRFISAQDQGSILQASTNSLSIDTTISLAIDDTSVDTGVSGRGIPNYINALSINPSTGNLWYGSKKDNILRGQIRDGVDLTFETTVRAMLGKINVSNEREVVSDRIDIDDHTLPSALEFTPSGGLLFVTMLTNDRLIVMDPKTRNEITRVDVGSGPQAITFDSSNSRLFVKNFLDRSISIFDASQIVDNGSGELTLLDTINVVANERLTNNVLQGKKVFYNAEDPRMSIEGYMSCASCHLDGDHDGRVWDFTQLGEGLRNTIYLRGVGGMNQGLLHWTGNFDEIQDFENPIRSLFGGSGFIANSTFNNGTVSDALGDSKAGLSQELDDMADYVSSLDSFGRSPHKPNAITLSTEGLAGKDIFQQLNCQSCHAGSEFTNSDQNVLHDVGTIRASSGGSSGNLLEGLDTPTLKGLWKTAPYLHDGSAATLREVFSENNSAGLHGDTSALSNEEITQLISFLNQIDDNTENVAPAAAPPATPPITPTPTTEPPATDDGDNDTGGETADNDTGATPPASDEEDEEAIAGGGSTGILSLIALLSMYFGQFLRRRKTNK